MFKVEKSVDLIKEKRKLIYSLLSIVGSSFIIYYIFSHLDTCKTYYLLNQIQWTSIVLLLIVTSIAPIFATVRFWGIIKTQDKNDVNVYLVFKSIMVSQIVNSFVPTKGGDFAKALFLRKSIGFIPAAGGVVLERMVDLFILGLLGICGFAISGFRWALWTGVCVSIGILIVFFTALWFPVQNYSSNNKITKILSDVKLLFRQWIMCPRSMIITIIGSIGSWAVGIGIISLLINSLDKNISLGYIFSIYPLAVLAGLLPFTVSGIGTRDSMFIFLFNPYVSYEESVLIGMGYTIFAYGYLAIIALFYFFIIYSFNLEDK